MHIMYMIRKKDYGTSSFQIGSINCCACDEKFYYLIQSALMQPFKSFLLIFCNIFSPNFLLSSSGAMLGSATSGSYSLEPPPVVNESLDVARKQVETRIRRGFSKAIHNEQLVREQRTKVLEDISESSDTHAPFLQVRQFYFSSREISTIEMLQENHVRLKYFKQAHVYVLHYEYCFVGMVSPQSLIKCV